MSAGRDARPYSRWGTVARCTTVFALSLLLTACGPGPAGGTADRGGIDPASDRALESALAAAAGRSATALERLAAAEAATAGPLPAAEPGPVPAELLQRVDFAWTGPLEAAVRALAALAGYDVSVSGGAAAPVVIAVQANDTPLIAVLRSAGLQAGGRATLRVDPARRLIEVIHGG